MRLHVAVAIATWIAVGPAGASCQAGAGDLPPGVRPGLWEAVSADPAVREAIEAQRAYLDAIQAGGAEAGVRYWHPLEAERYPMVDWKLGYRSWRLSVTALRDSIIGARTVDDGSVEITVRWSFKDNGRPSGDDVYHWVDHHGRRVAVNAIFQRTRDWMAKAAGRFVYHWPSGPDPFDAELVARNEAELVAGAARLDVDPPEHVDFYWCPTRELVGQLFDLPASVARAHEINAVVAAVTPFGTHGLGRVLYFRGFPELEGGDPFGAMAGGIAYALFGGVRARPDWLLARARELDAIGALSTIQESFNALDADDMVPSAAHLAAVTDYVLRRFGSDAFFQIAYRARHFLGIERAFEKVAGAPWSDIAPDFSADLAVRAMPWVGVGEDVGSDGAAGDTGPVLFESTDPDGDVADAFGRPPELAPAVFDLRHVRVIDGGSTVRFEIELGGQQTVDGGWGFADAMVHVFLRTGATGGAGDFRLDADHVVQLEAPCQRYLGLSPDGVLLKSWRGEWLLGRHDRLPDESPLGTDGRLVVEVPRDALGLGPEPTGLGVQVLVTGHRPAGSIYGGVGSAASWSAATGWASSSTAEPVADLLGQRAGDGTLPVLELAVPDR